jgi:prepilin-type N-terminal cleavage/methylation domain-containing protein
MKRQRGFTIIELTVAMAILTIIVGAAVAALVQAQYTTNNVAQMANEQENLRAGMHFVVRDLIQAGEGIPPQGISVPNTAALTSAINRPVLGGIFPGNPTALSVVIPGWQQGPSPTTVNPQTGVVLTGGLNTDTISIVYADNTLASSDLSGTLLSQDPVTSLAAPVCNGLIDPTGLTVTLSAACFLMPGTPTPIRAGDLIMFSNTNGTALEYVTTVAGQVITFAAADPAGLNQTGLPNGTVAQINAAVVPTIITRVWMVTYYIDTVTNPAKPQLIRQVNYPGYPAAAPTYPAQQIADCIEDLSFTYDITNSNYPGLGTYPAGPGDAPTPTAPDTPFQIRAVNAMLAARSEYPMTNGATRSYFRNNLSTQVSIRSLAFVNQFNVNPLAP